jgi:hypothetical protein
MCRRYRRQAARCGEAINPYIGKKNFDDTLWIADGYRQFIILARDKAFGYLPWYQPLVAISAVVGETGALRRADGPVVEARFSEIVFGTALQDHGNCAARSRALDLDKARRRFPERPRGVCLGCDGTGAAVNGISIGNCMVLTVHD